MSSLPILIAGAGIGGLTAANALRSRGFETEVFDRALELRPAGAGLTIQANAVRALSLLRLDSAVQEAGWPFTTGEIRRADGRRLGGLGFEGLVERIGAPMVGIRRSKLQALLLREAGPVTTGLAAERFESDADGVTLRLSDGSTRRGALLIGADGIHSAIRAELHGRREPRYSGYTCWRGTAEMDHRVIATLKIPDLFEIWGRGTRFGGVRVDSEHVYWFAVRNAPPRTDDEPGTRKARLIELFASSTVGERYASPVPELLEATPESTLLHNDIVDRPPSRRWGRGRVTLLGDAAHPMTPNMGQGACQAIEDAVVLADRVARSDDPVAGLRRYETARMDRANGFVDASHRFGRLAQWAHPLSCRLRDAMLALTPTSVVRQRMIKVLTMTPVDSAAWSASSRTS
ncbi:MAG: FAD-dependent monooxygenase [Acidobacteriota bacterium]